MPFAAQKDFVFAGLLFRACSSSPQSPARSVRTASPIQPSSRPCRAPTSSSCGYSLCSHCYRRGPNRPDAHGPGRRHRAAVRPALHFRDGREKLAAATVLGRDRHSRRDARRHSPPWLGTFSPWSPVMDAWSATPTPIGYVKGRTPLELQGALLVQSKQCRNCHSLDGEGGMRGPRSTTPRRDSRATRSFAR